MSKNKCDASSSRGFTLIELMVVVAVLSIFLTVGIPSFTQSIKSNRLSAAASEVVAIMNYARAESARRGVDVVVSTTNGSGSNEWGGGVTVSSAGVDLREIASLNSTVTADGSAGVTAITFSATGMSDLGATEVIEICDDRTAETGWQITVLVSGIINLNRLVCS